MIFKGVPKSSKSSISFDESVVLSCFGDRETLYGPRDTYVDAEFDGEFIADVYFLFWVSLDDENLKKTKNYFPENIFRSKIFSDKLLLGTMQEPMH